MNRKIISFLLVFVLSLVIVGCSKGTSSSTDGGADKPKDNKTAEVKSLLLKGKIVGYTGGSDVGDKNTILLDNKLNIEGKEIERVWLDDNSIENFIPRKYFSYILEGGPCLKEEFIEKVPVEVEIDPDSVEFQDFYTYAKVIKVVSVDGETNPKDKTKDEYPMDYYKDVFNALISPDNIDTSYVCTVDIKDYYLYKDAEPGDDFRAAVDKILESGLYINMLEGEYEIDTEKRYSEEGVGD